ncbi:MAG: hypothetical protein ACC660_05795 [Acidimicrobiales bacterium]
MPGSLRSLVPRSARPTLRVARIGAVVLRPRRNLFLFSHMRSYSSLLGHILGSNPEINGYAELQMSYRTELDIIRSILRVYETNENQLHGKYIFDKVLHGHLKIGSVVLDRTQAVGIFAVREPADTLRSTVAMARRHKNPDWKGDAAEVADYYSSRLTQLAELAESFRGPTCVLEAEALMTRTDEVLDRLTRFLKLKTPLRREYEVFSNTGRAAYGDPGKHIGSGRLVVDREPHDEIQLDPELLVDLEAQRQAVMLRLREACDVSL